MMATATRNTKKLIKLRSLLRISFTSEARMHETSILRAALLPSKALRR
jgi:hypothetical protein